MVRLKVGDGLQALGIRVTEVMAHRPVKMQVDEAGDRVQPRGIDRLARVSCFLDALAADIQIPLVEHVIRTVDLSIPDDHRPTSRYWTGKSKYVSG